MKRKVWKADTASESLRVPLWFGRRTVSLPGPHNAGRFVPLTTLCPGDLGQFLWLVSEVVEWEFEATGLRRAGANQVYLST